MASLEGYQGESGCDRFKDHIERSLETGYEAQGSPTKFAPFHSLTQYWTTAKVQGIMFDTEDTDYQIEDIQKQYLRIFSILVWISMTGQSYARYLKYFLRVGINDHSLPFRHRPACIPSTLDSELFWTSFFKNQWTFCPAQIGFIRIYNRDFHPNQILPLTICDGLGLGSPDINKPAKIRLAKVHASEPLSTGGHIVLKSYDSPHEISYENEIKAYHALTHFPSKACDNIIKYIGSYYVQPPAPGSGLQYTIMLEYAEGGSLLGLYEGNHPPFSFSETKAFWSSLLGVTKALMHVHNTTPKSPGSSCVHQDLKPSNIFVSGGENDSVANFGATLKIGDFGNSHTRKSAPNDPGRLGYDSGSTRTYSPPELYWNHELDVVVGPQQDMWSLGCVLVEAAVWLCFGQRGRTEFQQRRRDENDQVAPRQRGLGRSDCFHNGKSRLMTVEEVFNLVQRDGRNSDELTPKIVRLVLDHLLVDEKLRFGALNLSTELDRLIQTTTDCTDYPLSNRISLTSAASRDPRSSEFHYTQHDSIENPHVSSVSQYRTPTPSEPIEPMARNQMEGIHAMGMLSSRSISVRSRNGSAEFWNYSNGTQRSHGMDHGQLATPFPESNTRHDVHSAYSAESPVEIFHSEILTRLPTEDIEECRVPRPNEQAPFPRQPWPAQEGIKGLTNINDKRTTFPDISMKDVTRRRALGQPPKFRPLLQGEDQAMMFLKKRDHVFIVDNSKHMREYKDQVLETFANLAYILEAADPNGLDVMCTSDPVNIQNNRSTEKLVQFVQNDFDKGASGPCFIERALQPLVGKVIDKLPSGPGEKRSLLSRIMPGSMRPISIYVLTSGVWDSSAGAKAGTCGAERPITLLIRELERRNLHKNQVAIQFIRFGNHQAGIDRLKHLDDGLAKSHYDIVDHKSSNGSVWPMLIGSLDEGNDREESN